MKPLILALSLIPALAAPLAAQATEPENRFDQFMGDLLERIDPYLGQLSEMMGDLSGWHAPEVLPNGDILIRRRQADTAPDAEPSDPEDGSEAPIVEPLEL